MQEREGIVRPLLNKLGVNVDQMQGIVQSEMDRLPRVQGVGAGEYLSPDMKRPEDAQPAPDQMHDDFTSTEHLLLGLSSSGKTKEICRLHGFGDAEILKALQSVRGRRVSDQNPEEKYQALERYGRDLVQLARRGKLDPVIGRDAEIRRVVQCSVDRTKNNPVLIGEAGVGKTAIVEGRPTDRQWRRSEGLQEQAGHRAGHWQRSRERSTEASSRIG
ncbi:MAG: Clp protease N-terminal domain-containing protein [Planctomycetota bacterium]